MSADHRPAIVASPEYFAVHPKPTTPRDLTEHRCISFRHGDGGVYRWELDWTGDGPDRSVTVAVDGPLVVDDVGLLVRAALVDALRWSPRSRGGAGGPPRYTGGEEDSP